MPNCYKCDRENTKYRCLNCKKPLCNVCSIACTIDTEGYSEENYLVGKCSAANDCSNVKTGQKRKQQRSETTPVRSKLKQPSLAKQPKLSALFSPPSGSSSSTTSTISKLQQISQTQIETQNPEPVPQPSPKARTLKVATANNWKSTALANFMGEEWFVANEDKHTGNVKSFNCLVCKMFAKKVQGLKNFSNSWAFEGSCNLRLSNVIDHANGEPHRKAMELHIAGTKMSMPQTSTKGQQLVTQGLSKMNQEDIDNTRKKFEVAYFIAKEELPLVKYEQLLKLEEKHGVEFGVAYRNHKSCGVFINFISKEMEVRLCKKINESHFFSVLADGSDDVSVNEKEAIFVQYLDTSPPGSDTIKVMTSFLGLNDLEYGNAGGIVHSIKRAFEEIDIAEDTLKNKLIGFGADGATVNRGNKEGVISVINRESPWVVYVWCIAHRLELSLKDALTGTCFDEVDDILLRLYYLYEKSPKKLRQLRELHSVYSATFEFEEGGVRPKRASGK